MPKVEIEKDLEVRIAVDKATLERLEKAVKTLEESSNIGVEML